MFTPRRRAALLASTLLLGLALPALPASAAPTAKPAAVATAKKTAKTTAAAKKAAAAKAAAAKAAKAAAAAKAAKAAKNAKPKSVATIDAVEAVPTLAGRLAAVKAADSMNYYPSEAGWSRMWTAWDAAQIDADLAKSAALGANNVRIIIFPNTFGYPAPKAEFTNRLAQFVTMAGNRGLTVKFTLFDWWDGYADVAGSTAWANTIVKPFKDDRRVIAVELQNEFDASNTAAATWARKMVPAMRASFPTMPLTFSVDGGSGAAGMAKIKSVLATTPIDYYDFHFYGNSERSLAMIKQAQAAVAPAPMVIGETGLNTLQNTEGEQAAFLARVFEAAERAGVQSVSPWTLTDFVAGAIPDSQVSRLPAQYSYGLFRLNGTAKPAAAVVRAGWTGAAMPSDVLDLSFEAPAGQTSWRAFMPELGLGVKTQAVARTGKWSIAFTNTGKTAAGSPSVRVSPIIPVVAGQKWHAEAWARGNATTGTTQVSLSWFDINDKWLGGASSAALPAGTSNWTKLAVDTVAPAGAASMQIHLKSGDNSGTAWFDDVAITAS